MCTLYRNEFTYPSKEPGETVSIYETMIYIMTFSLSEMRILFRTIVIPTVAFEINRLFENTLYCVYLYHNII